MRTAQLELVGGGLGAELGLELQLNELFFVRDEVHLEVRALSDSSARSLGEGRSVVAAAAHVILMRSVANEAGTTQARFSARVQLNGFAERNRGLAVGRGSRADSAANARRGVLEQKGKGQFFFGHVCGLGLDGPKNKTGSNNDFSELCFVSHAP
ncbi:hypothetical protein EB061_00765 [bacterium]|nr:hypothetical protein [bacterium]